MKEVRVWKVKKAKLPYKTSSKYKSDQVILKITSSLITPVFIQYKTLAQNAVTNFVIK